MDSSLILILIALWILGHVTSTEKDSDAKGTIRYRNGRPDQASLNKHETTTQGDRP